MDAVIISYTRRGAALGEKLIRALQDEEGRNGCEYRHRNYSRDAMNRPEDPPKVTASELAAQCFRERTPLIFIGAMGIAVRTIAPLLRDKLTDPPVLVLDEQGRHVIPVLSGHVGGANEWAIRIARVTDAEPVLTTATDLADAFAVDLFAKEQNLRIRNREGIAKVSVQALAGKPTTLSIQNFPPKSQVDVLVAEHEAAISPLLELGTIVLSPKRCVLGLGCRKGKDAGEIEAFAAAVLEGAGLAPEDLCAMASIDLKAEEPGLAALSRRWRLPFLTFDSELLKRAEGDFTPSEFVRETVGVDNVCERAAMLAAGAGGRLIVRKQAGNGVTAAVAERQSPVTGRDDME